MKQLLSIVGLLAVPASAAAQTPCGLPGVTVTVSPPIAVAGEEVQVTLTNGSSETITLPFVGAYASVHPDASCAAPAVWSPGLPSSLVPILPGGSFTGTWAQNDDDGLQVPPGTYAFAVWYLDDTGLVTCCAQVTLAGSCPMASAVARNGSGVNPQTLSSVSPPRLGGTWEATLDAAAHAPGQALLLVHAAPASGPITGLGELLVGGPRLFRLVEGHAGSTVTFSQEVPADVALCGLEAAAQGVCLGAPGARLSNALDLVLGL